MLKYEWTKSWNMNELNFHSTCWYINDQSWKYKLLIFIICQATSCTPRRAWPRCWATCRPRCTTRPSTRSWRTGTRSRSTTPSTSATAPPNTATSTRCHPSHTVNNDTLEKWSWLGSAVLPFLLYIVCKRTCTSTFVCVVDNETLQKPFQHFFLFSCPFIKSGLWCDKASHTLLCIYLLSLSLQTCKQCLTTCRFKHQTYSWKTKSLTSIDTKCTILEEDIHFYPLVFDNTKEVFERTKDFWW